MTVDGLRQEDIFRLVGLMKQCDDAFYEANGSWDDIFGVSGFATVKAIALFWARVARELSLPGYACMAGMPALPDGNRDEAEEDSFCESLYDYIMEDFDIAGHGNGLLEKAGISIDYGELSQEELSGFAEDAKSAAEESGKMLSDEEADAAAGISAMERHFQRLSQAFPEFAKGFVETVWGIGLNAEPVVMLHSGRVGRFISNKDRLLETLSKELYDAAEYLVEAVFNPLYIFFMGTCMHGLGADGEYWGVYTLGYIESDCEQVCDKHMRPFGDVALALLDRLLSDIEALAPEILLAEASEPKEGS